VALDAGGSFTVPTTRIPEGLSGAVKVGVRPEKITILPAEASLPSGHNSVRGRVMVATFTGVGNQYVVEVPSGEEFTVYSQNAGDSSAPRPGEEVVLAWSVDHTFVVRCSDIPSQKGGEQ
jgi:spermidine/putrescine transport system ATP-binding protein